MNLLYCRGKRNESRRVFDYRKGGIHMIWSIIVGALIGVVAGALTKQGGSMGWIANILAGLVGSFVGQALLGSWGPSLAGMALIPSIVGAIIVVLVVSFFLGRLNK